VAFAVAHTDNELRVLLNTWILLKREDQTITHLRRYWILGRDERPRAPRWSIVRDVLHWVEPALHQSTKIGCPVAVSRKMFA
jgi:hypothetical protein